MCVICKQGMHVLYVLDWLPLYGMSAIMVIPTFMGRHSKNCRTCLKTQTDPNTTHTVIYYKVIQKLGTEKSGQQ